MKKIFLMAALAGMFSSATVPAFSMIKPELASFMTGDDDKKKEKKKKKKGCCSKEAKAASCAEKDKASKDGKSCNKPCGPKTEAAPKN